MKTYLATFLLVFSTSCGVEPHPGGELAAKSEFSVLQNFEFDHRFHSNSQPFIVKRDALGSGHDVIGLPREGSDRGYVWLIANPGSEPLIKKMPSDVGLVINEDSLVAIEKAVRLDPVVKAYLAEQLKGD